MQDKLHVPLCPKVRLAPAVVVAAIIEGAYPIGGRHDVAVLVAGRVEGLVPPRFLCSILYLTVPRYELTANIKTPFIPYLCFVPKTYTSHTRLLQASHPRLPMVFLSFSSYKSLRCPAIADAVPTPRPPCKEAQEILRLEDQISFGDRTDDRHGRRQFRGCRAYRGRLLKLPR